MPKRARDPGIRVTVTRTREPSELEFSGSIYLDDCVFGEWRATSLPSSELEDLVENCTCGQGCLEALQFLAAGGPVLVIELLRVQEETTGSEAVRQIMQLETLGSWALAVPGQQTSKASPQRLECFQSAGFRPLSELSELAKCSSPLFWCFLRSSLHMESQATAQLWSVRRQVLTNHSWIESGTLPAALRLVPFDTLWDLHPTEFGKVKLLGKVLDTPRWQQTYGRAYSFTGMEHAAVSMPEQFEPYHAWANSLGYGVFNQMLVNWYQDGRHYIGTHSDETRPLVTDSPILSVSLGCTRTFRIRHKPDKQIIKDVPLPHGTVLVMGGGFQGEFKHEVPKVGGSKGLMLGKRINLTFRQFRE
eukprot:TRINITY_DN9111_c0_g1_i1.p1 TRINITY_DN9111_c0_g1~~TRINITY_DN9111_c0_g1_i1.p1  ORF type:complete len:361 (+),score=31.75 TRINITY_DN9111_c0_g1_i1:105-1187(+)